MRKERGDTPFTKKWPANAPLKGKNGSPCAEKEKKKLFLLGRKERADNEHLGKGTLAIFPD